VSKNQASKPNAHTESYEFRIQGHLSDRVAMWFTGMTITPYADGTTTIRGSLPDQTALHSILSRIRDMNIKLISINPIIEDPGEEL